MRYHDFSYEDALRYVKVRRPLVEPNAFLKSQLQAYELTIAAESPVSGSAVVHKVTVKESEQRVDDETRHVDFVEENGKKGKQEHEERSEGKAERDKDDFAECCQCCSRRQRRK